MSNWEDAFTERRFGLFSIAHLYFDKTPAVAHELLSTMIVLRAESHYAHGAIDYTACSLDFDPVALGHEIPRYDIGIHSTPDGSLEALTLTKRVSKIEAG